MMANNTLFGAFLLLSSLTFSYRQSQFDRICEILIRQNQSAKIRLFMYTHLHPPLALGLPVNS